MDAVTRLRLRPDLREQIVSHARTSAPREAVGLLGGSSDGTIMLALPLPNVAGDDKSFLADPYAQFQALRRLRSAGQQLLAIYHSHPAGCPHPSSMDVEYARRWPCAQVIVAFDDSNARMEAFLCTDDGRPQSIDLSCP